MFYLKSPLRYPGGKSRAVKLLAPYIPENVNTLCSPFFGGGSLELYLLQHRHIKVIGYDIFKPLICFWQYLLKTPAQLARKVLEYYPLPKTQFYSLQKELLKLQHSQELAAIYYVLNRCSFSGVGIAGGMSPDHPRFTLAGIDRLKTFQLPKKALTIAYGNYSMTIPIHNNDFLYCDPPYYIPQQLYGTGYNQLKFDHLALSKLLQHRSHWILSYNDCDFIRTLYRDCQIVPLNWTYGMGAKKHTGELLILP